MTPAAIDPRQLELLKPGFYKLKLVKGGPWVPVEVWETGERDPETGEPMEDIDVFIAVDGMTQGFYDGPKWATRIILYGVKIDGPEFQYRLAYSKWCKEYAPNEPEANPAKPIDFAKMKPIR